MSEEPARRPRLAITLGDPGGIGPEVALKSLRDAQLGASLEPVLIGSAQVLRAHADQLGYDDVRIRAVDEVPSSLPENALTVLDLSGGEKRDVRFGEATSEGGRLSMQAVAAAVDLCQQGRADAMVTAPISKEAIADAGYAYPGHTEFIAERTGASAYTMMMVADGGLRVGLVTGHMSVAEVPEGISQEAILEKIRIVAGSLTQDFGIERPEIAVLGLNPHAGDGGVLGAEEQTTIRPALDTARAEGFHVTGPFPADGFFGLKKHRACDAVLAMYHDQGLVPFKTLAFERGVNYTAGLPIVRTSPDHGTAYDLAGTGRASPGSMKSALRLAARVARQRRSPTSI